MRLLLVLLARGNLVMALSMAASTWLFQVFSGLPTAPLPPLLSFLVVYAIYSLDRVTELEADRLTHPERARFSRRNARWMRNSALAAYALALVLAGARGGWSLVVTLMPLAALLLYSLPFLPGAVARSYLRRAESSEDLHFLCDVVSDGEQLMLAGVVLLGTALPWA